MWLSRCGGGADKTTPIRRITVPVIPGEWLPHSPSHVSAPLFTLYLTQKETKQEGLHLVMKQASRFRQL